MPTPAQVSILEFMRGYHQREGIMPSTRTTQRALKYATQTTVVRHLQALADEGLVEKQADRRWGLTGLVLSPRVPVFGTIPAGIPIDAAQDADSVTLDSAFFGIKSGAPIFGLRVRGDSMLGAGIRHNDVVFLTVREPRSGDIVAALVDGQSTLKRYLSRGKARPVLHSENPAYKDIIPAAELAIQGVMVGLLRRTAA